MIIDTLKTKYLPNTANTQYYDKFIDFASSHFEEINSEEMKKLNIETLSLIMSNHHLRLRNEDSLLEFILTLYATNQDYSTLFEHVIFSNLKQNSINTFIEQFHIDSLDRNTWISIMTGLSDLSLNQTSNPTKSTLTTNRYLSTKLEFQVDSENKFNGILKYLNDKTGGNILQNGTINITSNNESSYTPYNMVDFQSDDYFRHENNEMSTILFDFKDKSIQMTHYSIHTGTYDTNRGHLKSWVIEGSVDGNQWDEIDNQTNNSSLNGSRYEAIFEVKHKRKEFYRYIRLRQTGLAWCPDSNNNRFEIMYIDFYGVLLETNLT